MRATSTGSALLVALSLLVPSALAGCGEDAPGIDLVFDGHATPDGLVAPDAADASSPPADVVPPPLPPVSCDADDDCDDGHACTVDRCDLTAAASHCVWQVAEGACFIHNVCRAAGEVHPGDPCASCDPAASPLAWTPTPEGGACDDGDACTPQTACQAGVCAPTAPPLDCDDGEACTDDRCDPVAGCVHAPLTGAPCDDGEICTVGDRCEDGACAGEPDPCDDGDVCTDDACAPGVGCVHTFNAAPCDDGDACTAGDACREGACVAGAPDDCDDHNACTLDTCDPVAGCVHLPTQSPCCLGTASICDDGDPCTDDLCDPLTAACTYVLNTAPCDDGDACTVGDVCADGACGGGPRDCDDGDPCTTDACSSTDGCVHGPISGPACDDGLACSTGDVCVDGLCVGDTSGCGCQPALTDDGVKVVQMALGASGTPGEGLDVDGDPATCAPASDCTAGIDNQLGILAGFANDPIGDAVAGGDITLVLMFSGAPASGPVEVGVFQARLASENAGCDVQTETCQWLLDRGMFDPETCAPLASMPGTLSGGALSVGGPGTNLPFEIPLSADAVITVQISNLSLAGTVTVQGGRVATFDGVLGGAVPKQVLLDGIAAVPEEDLPPQLPKDTVLALIDALVVNDIDTDGDGVQDAASIGVKLSGIDAMIVGTD